MSRDSADLFEKFEQVRLTSFFDYLPISESIDVERCRRPGSFTARNVFIQYAFAMRLPIYLWSAMQFRLTPALRR